MALDFAVEANYVVRQYEDLSPSNRFGLSRVNKLQLRIGCWGQGSASRRPRLSTWTHYITSSDHSAPRPECALEAERAGDHWSASERGIQG